jgi:hypothetical protein
MTELLAAVAIVVFGVGTDTATLSPSIGAATATAQAVRLTPPAPTVEQIIRQVWPDDLEDRAVRIATRESNLQPGVRNACCFGLFQIHWTVHRGWLADYGITSSSQLFDPRTNAEAAYALYQRAGGWGPWVL